MSATAPTQDEMTQQLIDGFKTLSFENKIKMINTLFENMATAIPQALDGGLRLPKI